MRRLLRLALPLGILVTLVTASAASAQVLTTKTDGPISLVDSSPTAGDRQNTDLAFWGNTLVQGDTRGIRIFDISNNDLDLIVDFPCAGAYGDVSIWNNLVFRSVDIPQDAPGCGSTNTTQTVTQGGPGSGTPQNTDVTPGWEGIQIIDISNPSTPVFVTGVATRCGSANHTLVPDLAQNRILLYSSSYPNVALGPNCQRDDGGTPALEHPSIDVVAVPLGNPAAAGVENQVSLDLADKNTYFDFMPGYTGVFNNTPGYKGCKDITVNLQLNRAAAACVSEGVLLDISDRENPTIIDRYTNPMIDLCATGVWRAGEAMNCMWNSAQFTLDGKRVIFGSLQSGNTTCSGTSTTSPTSCAQGGFLNVGVDPLYHGRSVTNECDLGGGAGGYRDLLNQGAFWMYDISSSSWPISSFKINRFERANSVGCTSSLMNVVPVNGRYVLPAAWQLGGMNVFDWSKHLAPSELAYYDVDATGANEQQQVVLTGFDGAAHSFRVRIGGNDSALLGSGGSSISNNNVATAINGIAGFAGGASVSGAGNGGFTVTFGGASAGVNLPPIEIVELSCAPPCTAMVNELVQGNGTEADATNSADASHAYAAYWYRGRIFVSYDAPEYGVHNAVGSRGLDVFTLDTPWANAAFDLPRLNPQTQEQLLRCSASINGNPVARRTRSVQVRVRFLGQPVRSARVNLRGPGVSRSKVTGANGNASFSVRPNRATRLTATVPAQVNMLGCSAGKNIQRAR
jgi:hypothetical protein